MSFLSNIFGGKKKEESTVDEQLHPTDTTMPTPSVQTGDPTPTEPVAPVEQVASSAPETLQPDSPSPEASVSSSDTPNEVPHDTEEPVTESPGVPEEKVQ